MGRRAFPAPRCGLSDDLAALLQCWGHGACFVLRQRLVGDFTAAAKRCGGLIRSRGVEWHEQRSIVSMSSSTAPLRVRGATMENVRAGAGPTGLAGALAVSRQSTRAASEFPDRRRGRTMNEEMGGPTQ